LHWRGNDVLNPLLATHKPLQRRRELAKIHGLHIASLYSSTAVPHLPSPAARGASPPPCSSAPEASAQPLAPQGQSSKPPTPLPLPPPPSLPAGQRPAADGAEAAAAALRALLARADNRRCADCASRAPTWASLNLGVFVCLNCAGAHRGLSTAVSRVRSCTLDAWTADGVAVMAALGNGPANAQLEARLPSGGRPGHDAPPAALAAFVRAKYLAMRWSAGGEYPPAAALAALHRPAGEPPRPPASAPSATAPAAAVRQPAPLPPPPPTPTAPPPRLVPAPPAVADLIQFSDSSSSSGGDEAAAAASAPPTLASAQAGGLLAAAFSDPRLNILAWLERDSAGPAPPGAASTSGRSVTRAPTGAEAGGTGASSSSSAPHAPYRSVPWFLPPGGGGPTRAGSGTRLLSGTRRPASGGPSQLPPELSFPTGASARAGYTGLTSASSASRGPPVIPPAGPPGRRVPQAPSQTAAQPPRGPAAQLALAHPALPAAPQARLDPRATPALRPPAAIGPALIWPSPAPSGVGGSNHRIPVVATYEYRPERDDDIASHR
jgi:hypothetical protein